jgi:signal transduction histidine kinase/ActR/RegA family two-component response regulator
MLNTQTAPVTKTGQLTLLVVDDMEETLELLEAVLSEAGYQVVTALDGKQALSVLAATTVHFIIADAMMPRMDGFQLCKQVKALPALRSIPFVMYTGNYIEDEEREFARSLGVDRYVMKYAGLGSLVDSVNELARQHYEDSLAGQVLQNNNITEQVFLERHHALLEKKLEEKMMEVEASAAHYRSFFENASLAIFILDPASGRVLEVNNRGKDLLQESEESILAMAGLPFGDPAMTGLLLGATELSSSEALLQTRAGRTLTVELSFGPILQPNGRRIIVYANDVTEQKRMEEQLLQAEKMTLMGKLASGIAHEIRNPLAAIRLNIQYIIQKNHHDEQTREVLETVIDCTQRIEQIIENTLGLARPTPPKMRPEAINEIIQKVIGFVRIPVLQKNVTVRTRLNEDVPMIDVDAKQIQQVMLNLLQNAIEASPQNGLVEVESRAEVNHEGSGGRAVVVIRDQGPGMSKETLDHLFEAFFTTKVNGTGLGLALSKQLIEKNNGQIRVESPADGGLSVRMEFPITR